MKDGSYRWFRAVGGVARDAAGNAAQACGSLIDTDGEYQAKSETRKHLNGLAARFESNLLKIVEVVSTSAVESAAQSMSCAAREAAAQMTTAAAGAEQATSNVHKVAAAAEELSASVAEITRQVVEAAQISTTASEEASQANSRIEELAAAAKSPPRSPPFSRKPAGRWPRSGISAP